MPPSPQASRLPWSRCRRGRVVGCLFTQWASTSPCVYTLGGSHVVGCTARRPCAPILGAGGRKE